jgi:hypothetical protein
MDDFLDGVVGGAGKIAGIGTGSGGKVVGTVKEVKDKGVGGAIADGIASEASDKVTQMIWEWTQAAVDGTQWLFRGIIALLLQMTEPQIDAPFIYDMAGRIFYISLPLVVLFAVLRIAVDSIRAKALAGGGGAFLGAGASVIGTIAMLPLTALAVGVVDRVADGLAFATLDDAEEFVDTVMENAIGLATLIGNLTADGKLPGGPLQPWEVPEKGMIATCVVCFLAVVLLLCSCVAIGLALVARNMLLYLVIVMGPLCLSGLAWRPTRVWASRFLSWMTALVFTRLAIVVVMGTGVLAVVEPVSEVGNIVEVGRMLTTVLAGVLMMVLAGFMPIACMLLFGWMGEGAVREISAAGMGAAAMLQSVPGNMLSAGQGALDRARSVLGDGAGGGGGGSGLVGGQGPAMAAACETGAAGEAGAAGAAGAGAAGGPVALATVAAADAVAGGGEDAADAVTGPAEEQTDELTREGQEGPAGGDGDPENAGSGGWEQPYSYDASEGPEAPPADGPGGPPSGDGGPTGPIVPPVDDPGPDDLGPDDKGGDD